MTGKISMNHGVKLQVLIENLRKDCHYFIGSTDTVVCSRVKKHHKNGRIAFMKTSCGGNIGSCQLSTCHILGELNGQEAWHPEEGVMPHSDEPGGSRE